MLTLYDNKDDIPEDIRLVKSNDAYFNAHTVIPDTDLARMVLNRVDKAERISKISFRGMWML